LAADNEGIAGIPRRLFAARAFLSSQRGAPVTQGAIGRAVGVTEGQIGHWEKGRQTPDLPMIEKLALALDVAAPWLAYGVGPKERPAEVELPVQPDPALDRKVTASEEEAAKKIAGAATPRRRRKNG
jgi:transcriptional regulator with XRE-family HTH domain